MEKMPPANSAESPHPKVGKGEKIGGGQDKEIFEDARNPERVIAEFRDKMDEQQIKGTYYLNKIAHLLFPKNIPEVYSAGNSDRTRLSMERIKTDPFHEKVKKLTADDEFLRGKSESGHQTLSETEVADIVHEAETRVEDPRIKQWAEEAKMAGLFIDDRGGQNFSFNPDGSITYLDLNPPWVYAPNTNEMMIRFDEQKMRVAIEKLPDAERKEAEVYLKRLNQLMVKNERFEGSLEERNPQKKLRFENVEITPDQDFSFDLNVRKHPIEIHDGDKLGTNSVEVKFRDETLELLQEAKKLQELPEEERLVAIMELVHAKLKYPYPEVIESAQQENPDLKEWFEQRVGKNQSLMNLELNEFLKRGYGDCKIMAAAYLIAAQSAKLKGIYASSGSTLKNVSRQDNGKPIFRSVEVDRDLNSAHAWIEIQLSNGRWIPVDTTANMIGLGNMLETFKEAGYKVPVAYAEEGLPKELELDRGNSFFEPGESEKELHPRLKIGKDFITRKLKTDKYSGNINMNLASVKNPKSMLLNFKE